MYLLITVCQLELGQEGRQFISWEAVSELAVLTILPLLITRFFSPADLHLSNSEHSDRFATRSLVIKSGEIKTSFYCFVFLRLNDLLKIAFFTLIESKVTSKGRILLSCFMPKRYSFVFYISISNISCHCVTISSEWDRKLQTANRRPRKPIQALN